MRRLIDRREALKFMALTAAINSPMYFSPPNSISYSQNKKNILIIVFDAFSARHVPFYGYPRNTMPNLSRMLDKAVVYHNHFASGNFTSPGTASLLTGTYPWIHGAINLGDKVISELADQNIFSVLDGYYRLAYTHNPYADVFLRQFFSSIDGYTYPESLYLTRHWLSGITKNDLEIAKLSTRRIFEETGQTGNSLFLKSFFRGDQYSKWLAQKQEDLITPYKDTYPRGLPSALSLELTYDTYIPERAVDWVNEQFIHIPKPFLGYVHLLPPHAPYNTRDDFVDVFANDGYLPGLKPTHITGDAGDNTEPRYAELRQHYDEFLLYVDEEFNRIIQFLTENDLLDNTVVIFTSDHGEIFERGFTRHNGPSMHQPIIQVPLIVFDPDISQRVDVHEPTSAVDILPTLIHLCGNQVDQNLDGMVLPPYRQNNSERNVFALQAAGSSSVKQLSIFSGMVVNGSKKLTLYSGYPEQDNGEPHIELYDIQEDPDEMVDLYNETDALSLELVSTLLSRLEGYIEGKGNRGKRV